MAKETDTKTKKVEKKTLVLLDAHAILHRAYHALPDFSSPSGEPTGALYGVVSMLLRIVEDIKPDYIAACYDLPEPTYRHEAFKEYKAGRKETDGDLIKQIIRSRDIFKVFNIPIYEHAGFEADDMLGTIVEQTKNEKNLNVVIASGDMDTFQLITKKKVQVYMQRKGSEIVLYDEAGINKKFGFGPLLTIDYKGIRGDASDNIPGVKGVGETSALKLIQTFGSLEKIYAVIKKDGVEKVALKSGVQKRFVQLVADNEEEAEFSKMLATIRLDAPIDFVLPDIHWKEAVDTEAALSLFSELGFRTLATRIKNYFDISEEISTDQIRSGITDAEVARVGVLLWLLESERTNPSYEDIIDYGRAYFEATDFVAIAEKLEEELSTQNLIPIYEDIEKPLIEVVAYMNSMGILLNTKYLETLSTKMHTELSQLEKTIHKHAGSEEFNINSPKQMAEVLYDTLGLKPKNQKKTATGQRSTRESELEKMKDDHPIINEILRYRELQKLVSTYIDNLPEMVSADGRLRSTLLQSGTTTGRMASRDPNLQNIPTRTEEGRAIRKAFVAQRGYTIVAIDYSQIELRIAAVLSGDSKLIEIFQNREDVHSGVASRVFSVAQADVTRDMRRKAKVINFGILYGMGVNALRSNLGEGTSREEAQEFLNAYFNTFTRLAEYLEETKAFARSHGYTETLFGRRRHFPGIQSGAPFIRAQAERMAINAPVQGTAADAMRVAMNKIYAYITKEKLDADVHMLMQVHDELVFEIKDTMLDTVIPKLVTIMEQVLEGKEDRDVPILADVKAGPNWGELKAQSLKSKV
ncbi:DNA polymerase [Candidatus Pacebacteria bacterium]|nr:DNA polymerase [Candidatus Paceibacterota bacterium]